MKPLLLLSILFFVGSPLARAEVDDDTRKKNNESLWRDASALYFAESKDYLDTLSETIAEFRYWRQKIIKDRFDTKASQIEDILGKSNAEILNEIDTYVNFNGIENLDDVLMMRAAQLNYEHAGFELSLKMRQFAKATNNPEPPAPDYRKAIYFTAELLHRFPNSPVSDRAHYLLGYCLFEEGKDEKAAKVYERLLHLHPYSQLASEVKWRLGEYYFDSGQYNAAFNSYSSLVDKSNGFREKALYKLGATYYAQGKLKEADGVFERLFRDTQAKLGSGDPESETLYDEAMDYLAYLKGKGVKMVFDEDTDAIISERLAEVYRKLRNSKKERNTYLDFIANRPLSRSTPLFIDRVIESYTNDSDMVQAQTVRNKFVSSLSTPSFWEKWKQDFTTTVETQDLYEKHILASAQFYAEQAKRTQRKPDYETAIKYFKKFIESFPDSALVAQARFERAELQYFLGHYEEASNNYIEVVVSGDAGQYREEAAYGYLLAIAKQSRLPLEDNRPLKPLRDALGALVAGNNPSDQEKEFLKAVQFYVNTVPTGERRQRVLYRAAEIFFRHNQFEKSRQALALIRQDKILSQVTLAANRLEVATYDLEKNYDRLLETDRSHLDLIGPSESLDFAEVRVFLHSDSPSILSALKKENGGLYEDAATQYEQFAVEYPKAPEAPAALFKAGLFYRKASQIKASNRAFEKLFKNYPTDPLCIRGEFVKAANMVSLLQFEEAAKAYEVFGGKYVNNSLSVQAYSNATSLRRDMNQKREAASDFYHVAEKSHDDEIWFEAALFYKDVPDHKEASKILSRFTPGKTGLDLYVRSLFELAEIDTSHADEKCAVASTVGKKFGNRLSARSLQAIVGCIYLKTWAQRDKILTLPFNRDNWQQQLNRFENLYSDLFKKYSYLETTKNKLWTINALNDAGSIFERTAAQIQLFKPETSKSLREKAAAYYKKAFEISGFHVQAASVQASVDGLHNLQSTDFITDDVVWPSFGRSADLISTKWTRQSELEVAYEQSRWAEVETLAKVNLDSEESHIALARAYAEGGKWASAQDILLQCARKLNSLACQSNLLIEGYQGVQLTQYEDRIIQSLERESAPDWRVAMAQATLRQGRFKDAMTWAKEAVSEQPDYPAPYRFVAQLLREQKKPELARLTLEEGLRNTQGDDLLRVQLAYLYLALGMNEKVQTIRDEMKEENQLSFVERLFMAHDLIMSGKYTEAVDVLSRADSDKEKIETGIFSLALAHKDLTKASDLALRLEPYSRENSYTSYLLGVYYQTFKNDVGLAKKYFSKSREMGEWRFALGNASEVKAAERKPSSKEEVKK